MYLIQCPQHLEFHYILTRNGLPLCMYLSLENAMFVLNSRRKHFPQDEWLLYNRHTGEQLPE